MQSKTRYAGKADMRLIPLTRPFDTPANIPLSYTIGGQRYMGIPDSFSPKVTRTVLDANLTQMTVTARHPAGIELRVMCILYRDFPVTEWEASFTNRSEMPSPIIENIRIETAVAGKNPVLCHGNGDTCTEEGYELFADPVTAPVTLFPNGGLPCMGASPYMRVQFADYGVNLLIGWSACWIAEFAPTEDGVSLSVGQKRCHMTILPGETMRTPRLTLMAYAGDEEHGRNLYRHWYFAHILPRENGEPLPPYLCLHVWNVDGPEFTGTTVQKQLTGLDTYVKRGMTPDIWWIDAGWYPCAGDWTATGTWEHDTVRFPDGLAPIGKRCEEYGTRFLLWMEPERVRRRGTWIWDTHPEWVLTAGDGDGLLDIGNPECYDWLVDHVDALIKEYHVHIYRQDFNIAPGPFWENAETEDRIGAKENLHVQAYLRFWDALIDRNPGLWIDSCSSGGRRNDPDTMRRAVPLHYTDVGYGKHPVKLKQHRMMFEWIPYFRAHNQAWDNADGVYDGTPRPVDRFAFHCALAPSLTNMTTYDGPEEEYETAQVMLPVWRRAAEIELRADYYPLTECRKDAHDWYAMQFDDPDAGDGFVQIIRMKLNDEDAFTLRMKALDTSAEYFFENMETGDMMQLSGEQLEAGIPLTLEKRSGTVWFYHKVAF